MFNSLRYLCWYLFQVNKFIINGVVNRLKVKLGLYTLQSSQIIERDTFPVYLTVDQYFNYLLYCLVPIEMFKSDL